MGLIHVEKKRKRCAASVSDKGGWHTYDCMNPAKYGEFCGVHCPQKQKEREARRGPTEYEKQCARERAERARVKALESSHAELLKAMYKIRNSFDPDVRDMIAYEAIKRVEEKQ